MSGLNLERLEPLLAGKRSLTLLDALVRNSREGLNLKTLTQPLKWHGGKKYLAPDIIAMMPPRCKTPNAPSPRDKGWLHYVEPYFGGGAVLLANDPEGISEVANDVNGNLTNFWRVLQDEFPFKRFLRLCQATPFSQNEYDRAEQYIADHAPNGSSESGDSWTHAHAFFVVCRQSLSGRMKGFTGIARTRTRRGMNEGPSAWLNAVEGLPDVRARLMRVLILNKPAREVIKSEDGPRALFYLDPPYLHETRATTDEYGDGEMTFSDHSRLLAACRDIKGRFLLSGYRSNLYDGAAKQNGWKRRDFQIDNKASGGKTKRLMTECVWTNY